MLQNFNEYLHHSHVKCVKYVIFPKNSVTLFLSLQLNLAFLIVGKVKVLSFRLVPDKNMNLNTVRICREYNIRNGEINYES